MGEVLLGFILGAVLAFLLLRAQLAQQRATMREEVAKSAEVRAEDERARAHLARHYESRIRALEDRHRAQVTQARRSGANQSRVVLKGKMAEQIAPLLPGFAYWPADARFLGDPVDYVVFNGYSRSKEGGPEEELELVILDIKQGKSGLSQGQRQIARAVSEGRVRFEMVRVLPDGTVRVTSWPEDGEG